MSLKLILSKSTNLLTRNAVAGFCRGQQGAAYSTSEPSRPCTAQSPNMMDIGTRDLFNSDYDIFRSSARKFYTDEIKPLHEQWETDGYMPKEMFLKAGEAGVLCTDVPEEYGGPGGDFKHFMISLEEQSYANCSAPGFGVTSGLVVPYLMAFGSEDQKNQYLPEFASGRAVGALAMTEPSAGSDLQSMKTNAKKDGDDWILNGSKIFISNGIICDYVLVAAISNPQAKSVAHGMSIFMVDANAEGFKRGRSLKKLGLKGQDTAELFFEDIRLPADSLIGGADKGFHMLMHNLPLERLGIGIGYAAYAEYMFEETRNYCKERKAFGKRVIDIQVVRHKLADLKMKICSTRAFVDQCCDLYYKGQLGSGMASQSKILGSDLANEVAYDCLQLHGGYGYMEEYPISRAYRDVRIGPIYGGTNEIMRELIGREIAS